jgi:hypothetical protein
LDCLQPARSINNTRGHDRVRPAQRQRWTAPCT